MSAILTPAAETARYIDSLGPEALAKAEAYTSGNHVLLFAGLAVSLVVAWLIVRLGLLDRAANRLSVRSWALATLGVSAAYFAISDLIELPWTLYTDWQRQHSYGLSKQPLGDFLGQWALGEAIGIVLGALFMLGVYALIRKTGARWWLWGGGLTAVVALFMLTCRAQPDDPLFNEYKPVPAGKVRTALEADRRRRQDPGRIMTTGASERLAAVGDHAPERV